MKMYQETLQFGPRLAMEGCTNDGAQQYTTVENDSGEPSKVFIRFNDDFLTSLSAVEARSLAAMLTKASYYAEATASALDEVKRNGPVVAKWAHALMDGKVPYTTRKGTTP